MPEPFLVVCIRGLLCCNEGVELAEMPKPFFGVCVQGLSCHAASPAIAGDDVRNRRADQFETDDRTGILPGDIIIVLAFAAAAAVAAASTFVGGGVGICNIVVSLGESWVMIKLCKY